MSVGSPTGSSARTSSAGGSFCARISASASSRPKSRSHTSAIQSGYECLSGPSGSDATRPRNPFASRRMTAFVNGTARSSPRGADELDRVVGHRMHGLVAPAELVGAETQRRDHRRIELSHRPLAELLDAEVDRPRALHRPVGEPLRERPVAVVEPRNRRGEDTVGVRLLGEHPPHDLVRGAPRRCDHRNPRTSSS